MTNLNLTDMETCTKVFKREVIQDVEHPLSALDSEHAHTI